MDEILKELETVYQTISSIPVTHDSVDAMAVARSKLRKIYAQMKEVNVESTRKEETNE
jgi:hypothetical protein